MGRIRVKEKAQAMMLENGTEKTMRASLLEASLRIAFCVKNILNWYTNTEIKAKMYKRYGIWDRSTERYLRSARKEIMTQTHNTIEAEISMHEKRYINLYNDAYKQKNFAVCNNILKNIALLRGIEAPKRQISIVKLETEDVINKNDEAARAYLQKNSIEVKPWD